MQSLLYNSMRPDVTRYRGGYMHISPTALMWDRHYGSRKGPKPRFHTDIDCGAPSDVTEVTIFQATDGRLFVHHEYSNPDRAVKNMGMMAIVQCVRCAKAEAKQMKGMS